MNVIREDLGEIIVNGFDYIIQTRSIDSDTKTRSAYLVPKDVYKFSEGEWEIDNGTHLEGCLFKHAEFELCYKSKVSIAEILELANKFKQSIESLDLSAFF